MTDTFTSTTKVQEDLMNAHDKVIIVAAGAGAGTTVALEMKALASTHQHVVMVFPNYMLATTAFQQFVNRWKDEFPLRVSRKSLIITLDHGVKIKFVEDRASRGNGDCLLIVSRGDLLPSNWLNDNLMNNDFIIASKPHFCGWREFEYDNGIIVRDHDKYVVTGSSWDSILVDWDRVPPTNTKVKPYQYKKFVTVLTGYGFHDNPHLPPTYSKCLESLSISVRKRLSGEWFL